MKTLYVTILESSDGIGNYWGYVAGAGVYVVDHWSGFAAFLIFATQLAINIRKLMKKDDDND